MTSVTRIVYKICVRLIFDISHTKRSLLHYHVTHCSIGSSGFRSIGKPLKVHVKLQCVRNIVTTATLRHTYRLFHKLWTQFYPALFRCCCQILVDTVTHIFRVTFLELGYHCLSDSEVNLKNMGISDRYQPQQNTKMANLVRVHYDCQVITVAAAPSNNTTYPKQLRLKL